MINTFVDGVAAARGETPNAASTFVTVVVPVARSYQLTLSLPEPSTLRSAGMKCRPPSLRLSWISGDAGLRLASEYDCMRMSPNG